MSNAHQQILNLKNLFLARAPLFWIGGIIATDGQWMALGVEDPLVERQHLVGGEGQVEVFQSGREKVGVLKITFFCGYFINIFNR